MVLKTCKFNCGSCGSLLFVHMTVLEAKKTILMNGSRLTRSDCIVRFGFQNHENEYTKYSHRESFLLEKVVFMNEGL